MTVAFWRTAVLVVLYGVSFSRGVHAAHAQPEEPGHQTPVTFNKDIAPIVFEYCAPCHRPGEVAPFNLLSHEDAKKHATQIVSVTRSRYMPPWLPEPGHGAFVGERRLSDLQIRLIQRWVSQGAPEGVPEDLPHLPKFTEGWQLGEPDLIVQMPETFTVPSEGSDVFRNFVLSIPVESTRYVRALELRPGNKKVVHHANILIDRTGAARRMDESDPGVGFGGMELTLESEGIDPDSHFLFWKPGTVPYQEPEDMAWRLDKGTDLVLNMHLKPTGKPEVIQPSLGLYFTLTPPTRHPMLLQLEHDGALDIPPGKTDFTISDELKLPVDVDVLGVYPHAHYLGKDIQGLAILPDGKRQWLIHIKDWDINWQAVYTYVKPVFLPRGTVLSMRYTYDNSASNVRNPSRPPVRVRAGNRSADEMGHLWIQVLPHADPRSPGLDPRILLQEALMKRRMQKYPGDFLAHYNLGAAWQAGGRLDDAIQEFRLALRVRPESVVAHNNLGAALLAQGSQSEAIPEFREAIRIRPDYASAHFNLGSALLSSGKAQDAVAEFEECLRLLPDDAGSRSRLGAALQSIGRPEEAEAQFKEALRLSPDDANANYNLGHALLIQRKPLEALPYLERASLANAGDADVLTELGLALRMARRTSEAIAQFQAALRLRPESAAAEYYLAQSLLSTGATDEAIAHFHRALQLQPESADIHNDLGTALARKGDPSAAIQEFEQALRLDPRHPQAKRNLQHAKAQILQTDQQPGPH